MSLPLHTVPLIKGNIEANFARSMAFMAPERHHYDPKKMLEEIRCHVTHFQIALPDDGGEAVEVTVDNMRMAVFLLMLSHCRDVHDFEVGEFEKGEARMFFDSAIISDALAPHLQNHVNLRRFFKKGARVTLKHAPTA